MTKTAQPPAASLLPILASQLPRGEKDLATLQINQKHTRKNSNYIVNVTVLYRATIILSCELCSLKNQNNSHKATGPQAASR